MKQVSDFLPYIQPHLMGAPEPTVRMALVNAAIAFCEDTLALRETCEPFSTAAGVRQYELEPQGSQQQVARVITAFSDTATRLKIIPADQVGNPDSTGGAPRYAYTSRTGSEFMLNLWPVPDGAYSITVDVALRPTREATQLEDDLFDLWLEAMVAGTLARVAAIPNQPFSDPMLAASSQQAFIAFARKARNEARSGRTTASQRVQPRPFA